MKKVIGVVLGGIRTESAGAYYDRLIKTYYVRDTKQGINGLQQAGADFGLMAANSPHAVFDQRHLSPAGRFIKAVWS